MLFSVVHLSRAFVAPSSHPTLLFWVGHRKFAVLGGATNQSIRGTLPRFSIEIGGHGRRAAHAKGIRATKKRKLPSRGGAVIRASAVPWVDPRGNVDAA